MHTIVLLPGDGIGPEVIDAARTVLTRVAAIRRLSLSFSTHLIGGAALRAGQPPLPASTLAAARAADAVLLGAVGDPAFDGVDPDRRPERALLDLRRALGVFANLRPARLWAGLEASSPLRPAIVQGTNLVVVRELLGGLYYGTPRSIDHEAGEAINTMRYTAPEIERIARVAFGLARLRRGAVLSVDKANVLEVSRLWRLVVERVAAAYPDVTLTHEYVDAAAMRLALAPSTIDVLLTENMFGDILSDEAGAICGSLGLLPSASLGDGPGLFEPVHGSAPPLAGRNVANPIGAMASAAMLLSDGLGHRDAGEDIVRAIEQALESGLRTADIAVPGQTPCTTSEFTAAVCDRL